MNRGTIPIIAITLVVVGLVGMAVTMVFVQPVGFFGSMMGTDMDAMFIEQMTPHHDDAIAMAELAFTRAEHPEIKQLARDIIRTQTAENSQMRQWYREWFDADVPESRGPSGMMGSVMGGGVIDMADLENADPFDKAFIEEMIPHHQMAVMMSQMAGSATRRPEMQGLTQSIIEAQSTEITMMQDWYDEWYGR